jgi:cleavage stimulation factor subunit 2
MFQANPALAYALFQALLNMRLVDPNLVQELFNQQQAVSSDAPLNVTTYSTHAVSPTPAGAVPSLQAQTAALQDEQQRAMVAQIMSLTDEQISALPDKQRKQVLLVREQVMRSK